MSRRPFHKRFHGDFLMGTRQLTLEEKGAYNDLLDMMYDRGGPIPDEPRWIAGFLNCSTRKWLPIRDSLIASGKIILRGEYLSNPRMERELALDEASTMTAVAWGRMGGKKRAQREKELREAAARAASPELDLDPKSDVPASSGLPLDAQSKPSGSRADAEPEAKPNKINAPPQAPLKPARATIFQSPEERDTTASLSGLELPEGKPRKAPKAKAVKKATNAAKLRKGWAPAPLTDEVEAMVDRWPDGMLQRELGRFRDHAEQTGRTCKSWDAAWRNWLRKADDDWKRAGARPMGKPSGWGYARPR